MNIYADLFLTFAKIGVCTFGGGYAMLPILQRELVEKRGWATEEELSDYFAIGQCTPGVIADLTVQKCSKSTTTQQQCQQGEQKKYPLLFLIL